MFLNRYSLLFVSLASFFPFIRAPVAFGQFSENWQQVAMATKALRKYLVDNQITPEGGEGMQFIRYITYAPSDARLAFLGVDTDTLWKSEDSGKTWKRKAKGIYSNGVQSITVHPKNSQIAFAEGAGASWSSKTTLGIYRTTNGGDEWQLVKEVPYMFFGGSSGTMGGNPIAFSFDGGIIYAGTPGEGLFKSVNGGDSWSLVADYAKTARIFEVKAHPSNNSIVYLGTSGGLKKVTISTSAVSVVSLGTSVLVSPVSVVLISTANPQIIYAGDNSDRIIRSVDGGQNFSVLFDHSAIHGNSNPPKNTQWMAMSPRNHDYVFVSFGHRSYGDKAKYDFYYTHNGAGTNVTWQPAQSMDEKNEFGLVAGSLDNWNDSGDSWSEFNGGALAMDPSNENNALYFAGPGVVKKTTNGGLNWRYSNAGFTANSSGMHSLFSFSKDAPSRFATANTDRGLFFSEDSELTYTSIDTPYWPQPWERRGYGVALGHGETKDVIVAATGSHADTGGQIISVSLNKGLTWNHIGDETGETKTQLERKCLELDSQDKDGDGNKTECLKWNDNYGDWEHELITFSPTNPKVVYAGSFRSIDGGKTWIRLLKNVRAVYWGNGDIVYSIGASNNNVVIYKSLNKGDTWTEFKIIPTSPSGPQYLAASPKDPNKVYYGKRGAGVWVVKSATAAPEFKGDAQGLKRDRWGSFMLHALVTDPNNENVIYAGCLGILGHDDKTIFRSTNGGDAWQTINNNLYQTGINAIAVNPHNSYVYVSTWGGIRKLPPPPSGSDTTAPNAPTGFNLIP